MNRAPELLIIDNIPWDFFVTLTFKGTPSESARKKCYFAWKRIVCKRFKVPFSRLLWALREEDGAINGKAHAHELLSGFRPNQVTKGACFFMMDLWNEVTRNGRADTYQIGWIEGGNHVRDNARYLDRKDAERALPDFKSVHPGAMVHRNLAGGMSRIFVYDRRLRASSYILKANGFADQTDAKHSYETAKFGSEYVDQLTLANALLIHAARCDTRGKGSSRKRQTVLETAGRGIISPRRSAKGDVGAPDTVSQWSRQSATFEG